MSKFSIVSKKTEATKALDRLLTTKKEDEKVEYDPGKQAEGLRERLEGSGLDTEKFTDKRNIVEKALNLTPDQNFVFDVFELIGRPQQVVFNAIKASQEGEDVNKAMWEGFSGEKEVWFKEILQNAGFEDSGDSFGLDDVIGFAGDVFLDPVDLALIAAAPFSGGASAAVAFADNALDIGQATRKQLTVAEAALESVTKGSKEFKTLSKRVKGLSSKIEIFNKSEKHYGNLKKAAQNIVDLSAESKQVISAGGKFDDFKLKEAKRLYEQALHPLKIRKSPIDLAFRTSKWGIKNSFKIADTAVTKSLQGIDSLNIANPKFMAQFVDGKKYIKLSEQYVDFKKKAQAIFKASEAIPKEIIRKISGKSELATEEMLVLQNAINKNIDQWASQLGKTSDEMSAIVTDMIEFKLKPKNTYMDFLNNPRKAMDQATYDNFLNFIDEYLPGYKSKDELAESLFNKYEKDGVNIYDMKSENAEVLMKEINEKVAKQTEEYAKIEQKVKEALDKKKIAEDLYAELGPDVIIEKANGRLTITRSKASDFSRKQSSQLIDEDLVVKHSGESKRFDSNEDIRRAAVEQRDRSREQIKAIKEQIKKATPEQAIPLKQNLLELTEKSAKLDSLIANVSSSRAKLASKLEPITNPEKYDIEKIKEPFKDKLMEVKLREEFSGPKFYTKEESDYLQGLWEQSDTWGKAATDAQDSLNKMYSKLDELMGTNFVSRAEDGYVRHAITPEAKKYLEESRYTEETFDTQLKGNTSSFNSREWRMSVKEADRVFSAKLEMAARIEQNPEKKKLIAEAIQSGLFYKELNKSIADFIGEAKNVSKASMLFDELALNETFGNPEIFQAAQKGVAKTPYQQVVSKDQILNKLEKIKGFRRDPDTIDALIKKIENDYKGFTNFYVDQNLMDLIGVAGKSDEAGFFLSMVQGLNNIFKKFSLLTPGFHIRNATGNYVNLYLSGINMSNFNPYIADTMNTLKKGKDIFEKGTLNGVESLSVLEKTVYNDYRRFIESGFHDIAYELYDLPALAQQKITGKTMKDNAFNSFLKKNMDANKYVDNVYRMSLLKYSIENPEQYKRLGMKTPEDFVRYVLFDPNDLTQVERKYLRNAMPFYTFMKKNLVYQMQNVLDNPGRYNKVAKMVEGSWAAQNIDTDEIEVYKKENFWVPVFRKKDGEYIAAKLNLPIGDLGEFLQNPIRKILSSTTPAVRAPFEFVSNTQVYTGLPIEQFQGQKGYRIPGLDRKSEYLLNQLGVLNPASVIYDTAISPFIKKEVSAENIANGLGITSTGSVAREQRNRSFQELDALRQAMSYYKQQGADILTLDEIRQNVSLNKTTTNQILSRLRSTVK